MSWGQTTYTWDGSSNNTWTTAANWTPARNTPATNDILQFNTGTDLTVTGVPSQTFGRLLITNNSQITLITAINNHNINIGNVNGSDLQVDTGSRLTLASTSNRIRITLSTNATGLINGELVLGSTGNINLSNAGNNILINGKFTNLGGSFSSIGTGELTFGPNSEYHHARNGTNIPLASWNASSTIRVTGITTTNTTGFNQAFGNVILNNQFLGVNISFNPTSIAGNLTVENGPGGSFNQSNNAYTISGNFNLTSGNFAIANGNSNRTLNVLGNYTQTEGILTLSNQNNRIGTIQVAGNFEQTGGIITETANASGNIILNGGGPVQNFISDGSVLNTINWTITANSFVQTESGSTEFRGAGTFTINSGAILGIRSANGIATTGPTGHVRSTGTRTYNAGANYIFNGSTNQNSNPLFPTSANTIRIENTGPSGNNTILWERNVTVGGNLLVNQGNLNLGTFSLSRSTVGGTFSLGAGLKLTVGGASNFPANYSTYSIPCTSIVEYNSNVNQTIAGQNYGILILSGVGIKTFSSGTSSICGDFTISGSVVALGVAGFSVGGNVLINSGSNFTPGAFTYQVSGNWTREGTFIAAGSTIEFAGTGPATIGTSNFNNLSFTGSGTKTASGPLTVTGNVTIPGNFTAGAFTHTVGGNWTKAGTFIATGSTVDFNGTTAGSIGASNFNNLIFSGAGIKTATGNLSATGNLTITNNLTGGSFSHSIQGNWVQNGPYTQGTSTVSMIGTTAQTITATEPLITFYNLVTNNPSGVSILTPTLLTNTLTATEGILAFDIYLTMGPNSQFIRNGTSASGVTGAIQGSNVYDVSYQGSSKTTGAELSGSGLRNITLGMTAATTLSGSTNISMSGMLTVPSGNTLNMGAFTLGKPGITTSGTGLLITGNTSLDPIPPGITWTFPVRYSSFGKVIYGTYNGLDLAGTTGEITLAQTTEGPIRISSGQFTVSGSQTYTTTGSTVVFDANAAQNLPGIGFANVTLAGTGDKTFGTGTTISGSLSIQGTAVAKLGDINRIVETLTLNGALQSPGTYGSTASPATNKLSQYFGTTGIGVINVAAACTIGEWLGTVSSDWFNPANWCGGVPTLTTDVFIPSTAPNQPIIGANGAITRNLEIGTGATLTISGAFTLSVGGFWNKDGTFVPGTSTVDFVGDGPDFNALMGASNFHNVTYSGTGFKTASGPHTLTGNLSIPAGGNFAAGAFTHSINGNFSNLGFFLPEESTFEFGVGPSNINGASSFYNISVINGATVTLSGATEIGNFLTLTHGTLTAGSNLTMGVNSRILRQGTAITPTSITGVLQGTNAYDVLYLRDSKNAGAELSGLGLRNITIDLNPGNTLTVTATITHSGLLSIQTDNTLAMGGFALVNPTLLTLGQGILTTQHIGPSPLPAGKYFSFQVAYSNPTGGQKVVYGTYNGLSVTNTSGTTTLAPISDGGEIEILSGDFIASGTIVATGSTVRFSDIEDQSVPGLAFDNLILAGSGNKSLAGASSTSGILTILSPAIARLGSANHTAALLNFDTQSQPSGSYGSTASAAGFKIPTVFGTLDSGILTVAGSNCTPGLWLGNADNDWNNPANWCNGVPTSTTDVTISALALNMPIIGNAGAVVRNLTIEPGASLAFPGTSTGFSGTYFLEVYGNWTNNGSFLSGDGQVNFMGTGNQTLGGTESTSFYQMSLTKASNETLTINSNLTTINTLTLTSGTLIAGTNLTMGTNSTLIRAGNTGATTALTGTIQSSGFYDLIYEGNSKTTSAETTGSGLQNITLNLDASEELTATTNITHSGVLTIPADRSFDLATFTLTNSNLTTAGTGLLKTANLSNPPIPRGIDWSFEVNYTSATGGQRVVYGNYNTLRVLNTSGTTTIDPFSEGGSIELISGDFSKATGGTISTTESQVIFSGTGTQGIPGIDFDILILQGSGEKTFSGQVTITGTFIMDGTAVARLGNGITHSAETLILQNQGQPDASFGSTASAAEYKLPQYFGTTDTGILNVVVGLCTVGDWQGTISSDWFDPDNWCGGIPTATTDVDIVPSAPNQPFIIANGAVAKNITIQSGANLTILGSNTLSVHGNWSRDGIFTPDPNSTVDFTGSSDATIANFSYSETFANVTISGTGTKSTNGYLTINGDVLITGNFDGGDQTFYHIVGGNWTNNGTFTANTSVFTFIGPDKTIGGSSTSIFPTVFFNGTYTNTGTMRVITDLYGTGLLTQGSNSFLYLSGNSWIDNLDASTNCPNTVIYDGGAQTVNKSNYCNLFLSGTGAKTMQTSTASISGNLVLSGSVSASAINPLYLGPTLFIGENLEIGSGCSFSVGAVAITVRGDFTSSGTFNAGTSTMIFDQSGPQSLAGVTYHQLQLAGSGDKTFTASTTVNQEMRISGTALARLGTVNHSANSLILGGIAQPLGSFGSSASSAMFKFTPYFGTTDIGILDVATGSCVAGFWVGTVSSDWFDPANWCGGVPTATTDVLIVSTAPNQPVINANGAVAKNITIQTGASLEITGNYTLSVHGNWANSGTFTSEATSLVDFTGTPNAAIGAGNFANISFTGTGTKTINATLSVTGNITPVSTAVVLSGANSLTLNPDKVMEITSTGSVTTGSGKLILEPGSIYVNRGSSNPSLEVRQTFTGTKGWRMMGTPIASTYSTLLNTFETQGFPGSTNPTLQPNLLWWDETDKGTTLQGWRQPANLGDAVPAGRGHYFYVFNGDTKPGGGNYTDVLPKTITITGSEVNLASGIFDFGVTFTARDTNLVAQADTLIEVNQSDEGFNLIANPTASTLDFHSASGWTKTNIDSSIYVWDPATGAFLTWNGTTGDLGSGRIAPYQAFWVKANAASPALNLSGNGAKSLVNTDFFGRKLENSPPILEMNVAGEGLEARSYISFEPDGKLGEDPKDAYQLESLGEDWLLLYSYGSIKTQSPLVINNQPELGQEEKVIPLHLAASKGGQAIAGNYLMDWKIPAEWPTDVSIVLMDHISQKAIDMKKETMHSFSFKGPEMPAAGARKSVGEFAAPKAIIFRSPFESGEVNARTVASEKPQRPFTIYIGAFPDDRVEYLPDFPKLFAPVPNPFSQQTKIRFYLPVAENASVHIYNLIGQEVGSFPAQEYEAGIQELEWIPSAIDLPNGMYVIRLSTTSGQFTQKLIKN
ncbi:hypothetical protein B0E43_02120 [Algoriphagus sp. A40]|nr:hypothetical protein B0E43_02120 [Algoriphagus sp. A40]